MGLRGPAPTPTAILSPDELEALRRAKPIIDRLLAGGVAFDPSDLAPARWFTRNTLNTADNLAKAAAKSVGRVSQPGRHHVYSKAKVRERWPWNWKHPRTGLPPP